MKVGEGEGGRNRRGAVVGGSDNVWVPGVGQLPAGHRLCAFRPQHQSPEAQGLIATFQQRELSRDETCLSPSPPHATLLVSGSFASGVPMLASFSATRPISPHFPALGVVRLSV